MTMHYVWMVLWLAVAGFLAVYGAKFIGKLGAKAGVGS